MKSKKRSYAQIAAACQRAAFIPWLPEFLKELVVTTDLATIILEYQPPISISRFEEEWFLECHRLYPSDVPNSRQTLDLAYSKFSPDFQNYLSATPYGSIPRGSLIYISTVTCNRYYCWNVHDCKCDRPLNAGTLERIRKERDKRRRKRHRKLYYR